jgi:hypothetical protein
MTKAEKKALKLRVLKWVNGYRRRGGLPKLRYIPRAPLDPDHCALMRACADLPGGLLEGTTPNIPSFVWQFAYAFDAGEYPELIARD